MAGFEQIQAEVIARLGGRSDLNARAATWLDQAYTELTLSPRFAFWELETTDSSIVTVSGTRLYSLTGLADLWVIIDVRDTTNQRRLTRYDSRKFDELYQVAATGQFPTRYARFGQQLELDPTPGGAYTLRVRYRKRPAEWTTGAHLLGREYDIILTDLAVILGNEALERHQEAGEQKSILEAKLAAREDVLHLEDADAEVTLGVRMNGAFDG